MTTIQDVIDSLEVRGWMEVDQEDPVAVRVMKVQEEVGEMCAELWRDRMGIRETTHAKLVTEAVDIAISAIGLVGVLTDDADAAIADKLTKDEARGYQHNGS